MMECTVAVRPVKIEFKSYLSCSASSYIVFTAISVLNESQLSQSIKHIVKPGEHKSENGTPEPELVADGSSLGVRSTD